MQLDGEVILIDNDYYELEYLHEALKRLDYQVNVVHCKSAEDAREYLMQTQKPIFLIISEMDFRHMDGLKLQEAITQDGSQWKSVPFVFVANYADRQLIDDAYKQGVHGFFKKPVKLDQYTDMLSVIIKYWVLNLHPNRQDGFYEHGNGHSM